MLPRDDEWFARIDALDSLSPAATTLRYPTAEGRVIPLPARDLVEREIMNVDKLVQDVKKTISAPAAQAKTVSKPVASEHERKIALAKTIVSTAKLRGLEMPDNGEEQLAIYVDERGLSEMTKEVQTVSSFQDLLDAHSISIPKDEA
jgi:hypothetical protein